MKNKFLSIVTAFTMAFVFTAGIYVQAENIVRLEDDTLGDISKQHPFSIENPSTTQQKTIAKKEKQTEDTLEEIVEETPVETTEPDGEEVMVDATAYTADCEGCSGITKTGVDLNENPDQKVIAVDPAVIPLGTKVHVEGYGYATAEDIGGGIDGNEIDLYMQEHNDAIEWGRQQVKVTIID